MAYDFSAQALFHPETKPVFAEAKPEMAFDPTHAGLSLVNAWWLSNASHLAYYRAEGIGQELKKMNMELIDFFDKDGTQGFLAKSNGFAILAFRGTQSDEWVDIRTDINFPTETFQQCRVHGGFFMALDKIWPQVEPRLDELDSLGIPVWYTGHSLGAALATLAAARRKPAGLYTFGSPRVGDRDFDRLMTNVSHQRFVNCCDAVTMVPLKPMGFLHTGVLHFLTAKGKHISQASPDQIKVERAKGRKGYALKLPWLRPDMVKTRLLADHTIGNYSAGILNAIYS